jgi:2-isopropylmalate synthase
MTLPLGKHSGRHAFARACTEAGLQLDDELLSQAFMRFKALADTGQHVSLNALFVEVSAA